MNALLCHARLLDCRRLWSNRVNEKWYAYFQPVSWKLSRRLLHTREQRLADSVLHTSMHLFPESNTARGLAWIIHGETTKSVFFHRVWRRRPRPAAIREKFLEKNVLFFLPPRPFSIVFPSSTRNSFLGRRPAALQFSTDARDRSFFSSLLLSDGSANSSRRIFLSQNLWKIDRWWNRRMRFPRRRILILKKGIRKVRWWNRESEIKERRKFFTRSSSKEFSLFKLCCMVANSSIVWTRYRSVDGVKNR